MGNRLWQQDAVQMAVSFFNTQRPIAWPIGNRLKKALFVLLILVIGSFFIYTSKSWISQNYTRSISLLLSSSSSSSSSEELANRAQYRSRLITLYGHPSKPPNSTHDPTTSGKHDPTSSRTLENKLSAVSIIDFLIIEKVQLINLRHYEDCYLVLEDDVAKLKSVLEQKALKKQFSTSKEVGLDGRLFHWRKDRHKEEEIDFRFIVKSLAKTVFISVVYLRGKQDDIDRGFYWIPAFGKDGKAKAFSRFPTKTDDDGVLNKPANETKFEWEDNVAEFHECDYTRVKKFYDTYGVTQATDAKSEAFMKATVHLRKLMASWDVYNWLQSGTLLGWYRQCAPIPYTSDVDTASWATDYQEWMKEYFLKHDKVIHMYRRYGRKNDSLEFTFTLPFAHGSRIDLFFMYRGVNPPKNTVVPSGKNQRYTWMGLQLFSNYKKGNLIYPEFHRLCTAELLGYLVNIPCDPLPILQADYGPEKWFKPDDHFDWINSVHNLVVVGQWTPQEWDGGECYEKN